MGASVLIAGSQRRRETAIQSILILNALSRTEPRSPSGQSLGDVLRQGILHKLSASGSCSRKILLLSRVIMWIEGIGSCRGRAKPIPRQGGSVETRECLAHQYSSL